MESQEQEPDLGERIIPTGNVQILLHYRNPFTLFAPDSSSSRQPNQLASGLSGSWNDVTTNGETGVFAITFHTSGACHFFPFPMQTLDELNVELADIFGNDVRFLSEQLGQAHSHSDKIDLVESFLMRHFSPIASHDAQLIRSSLQIITQRKGLISTAKLADTLFVTPRTLERKFSTYLGKSPKQLTRIVRFQETLGYLYNPVPFNLTEVAYKNGYYDQAHFIHEFKDFTGCTPLEFQQRYACEPCQPSLIC
jgi:AraC-like DNA-binding protein